MKKRVLIVDDDPLICQGLSRALEREYQVETAFSGKEALERVEEGDYDVVLLDLVMPGIDGLQTLREIKTRRPTIRVVMITAYATVKNAVQGMKEGASDYLSKPFELGEVRAVLRRVLQEALFEKRRTEIEQGLRLEESQISLEKDALLKILSNPIRRETIELLGEGWHAHAEIQKKLRIEDPTKLSFHLRVLRSKGLTEQDEDRRYTLTPEGKEVYNLLRYLDKKMGVKG
jgi:DNA-binding response OmpR family regulator